MNALITGPILVTGGAGYIGGQTVLSLLDQGADVVVLDDLSTGSVRPFHENTAFYQGRIQDQGLVSEILKKHQIKSILHFAGFIKVDESISNPLKYYNNNTDGSRVLIEAAVHNNVETFLFSSTAAVYGSITGVETVDEALEVHPLNPYGWSKLFTERLLQDVSKAHGMQYGIFRYFNVAGADMRFRHGQFLEKPVHLIGRAIDALLGTAPPLQIFGNTLATPDGTGVRDYIHVSDLADAHVALLQNLQSIPKNRLLNLGYGKGHSVLDVIKCLEEISGKPVPYEFVPAREGEAASVVANVKMLTEHLAWKPQHANLKEIIATSLEWRQRTNFEK
ncbi:UDP-glucose 4-epimerase GalE [Kordiimonas pumila]|uniref:UDP-glucose 4-epimerase n=1 Tax=Kordiimonas pumila TaxID=2161677 RepID=A0ABV7D2U2_9PROT|nr:UDP-glucose 4-epimerase GalE [Kordiimonas pumila]